MDFAVLYRSNVCARGAREELPIFSGRAGAVPVPVEAPSPALWEFSHKLWRFPHKLWKAAAGPPRGPADGEKIHTPRIFLLQKPYTVAGRETGPGTCESGKRLLPHHFRLLAFLLLC